MPTVRNNLAAQRYDILLDDGTEAGFTEYEVQGGQVVMPHTKIDPRYEGQGLASQLVKAALEDIRASGRCVVPKCSYVRGYIARKPEWQSLVCPV